MTAEHLHPLLESSRDCELCQEFARGIIPVPVLEAIRMGRMTASGGVRGIVVGDMIRRLVSRTLAQQLAPAVEKATAPFQYALTIRAGCECIGPIPAQRERYFQPMASVRSTLCRGSPCCAGCSLLKVEKPSCFSFASSTVPSTFLWQDDSGDIHEIHQGEGGEQGYAQALFCLGQHNALAAVQQELVGNERLFAFHDDIYVTCSPGRVFPIFNTLRRELWMHSRIQIHLGKTQVWNRRGVEPPGWQRLAADAQSYDSDAVVCRGDRTLPLENQGLLVLGTPLGSPEFVEMELESGIKTASAP